MHRTARNHHHHHRRCCWEMTRLPSIECTPFTSTGFILNLGGISRSGQVKKPSTTSRAADSRCEKRWMQREISRRARAMKRREVARVALLVERSMAADPRLARERARVEREKQRRKRVQHEAQRKQEEAKRREREQLKLAREREEEEEREKRAAEKVIREGEKKLLRKTRQAFRKLVMNAYDTTTTCTADNDYTSVWKNLEEMNDDLELLCSKLTQVQLSKMTQELEKLITDTSATATVMLEQVKHHAAQTRAGISQEDIEAQRQREEARAAVEKKAAQQKANRAPAPWTKEELSTLAKAIKKYPAGGANRWETITLFINNICKPDTPRTKEECIEKYNQIAKQTSGGGTAAASTNGDTSPPRLLLVMCGQKNKINSCKMD